LVGEVTLESFLPRAMQGTQDNATERDSGIRGAVLQKCFAESTQRTQYGRVKRPLPKLTDWDLVGLTFRENPARFVEDTFNSSRRKLRGSNGCGNRAGIHTQGPEANKTRREIGSTSAAEGVKHYITCLCSPQQDTERKIEREHGEVRADPVKSSIAEQKPVVHFLTLIQVLPVSALLNVSHAAGCVPNAAFIAFETRL
jgi:hypothetical protein